MKATVKFNGKEYDAELTEKKVESKRWKPEDGEKYWYANISGSCCTYNWSNDDFDNFLYGQRNVFETKAEAEKHLEYLKSLPIIAMS